MQELKTGKSESFTLGDAEQLIELAKKASSIDMSKFRNESELPVVDMQVTNLLIRNVDTAGTQTQRFGWLRRLTCAASSGALEQSMFAVHGA